MSLLTPLRVRVEKDVIVRVFRNLKGKGTINVSVNQEVTPADIIGSANISPGFRVLNLATLLSVSPRDAEKYIKRKVGQRIYRDELLAEKVGFLGRKTIVTSPTDGILDYLNTKTGELKMTLLSRKEDLPAGAYGIVEAIDKEKGQVIIKAQVSLVHGVFGSGRWRDGELSIIGKKDELLIASKISLSYDGHILAGGSLIFKDSISVAISNGVRGIICGGMNAKDYKSMAGGKLTFPKKLDNDIGISIVVCEGFGSLSTGDDIYEILKEYDGKYISMDGNKGIIYLPSAESSSMTKVRATSLGPLESDLIDHTDQLTEFKLGLQVRIIGNSFSGEQGTVISLDKSETLLPSGIKTHLATIETRRRKIQVPVANLEIIL